ncbi:MAG: hypothetical protein ISQ10_10280 [Planctomycetes bacterium]|nr:hypothetical protein [Planctomycetota bacterium]
MTTIALHRFSIFFIALAFVCSADRLAIGMTRDDIPTYLLGDWDVVTANQWDREERGLITLRKVPVHAWVEITREKIRVLGREPNSQTDFVDSEYEVTFSGSSTPHKINLQDLEGYWEVKGIFQSDYKSATVTFAWGGQPRPEGFIDPKHENKYYSFELRRRQKSE